MAMLCSLFENNAGYIFHVHLLHHALSKHGQQLITALCQRYSCAISFYDIDEQYTSEFKISETDKRERIMCLTDSGKIQAEPVMQNTNLLCDNALATFGEEKTTQLFTLMHEFSQICQSEILRLKKDNKKSHV